MIYFDPSEYVRGLQQLVISDKKKIGFLCGAGTSLAKKNDNTVTVPAVKEMTTQVLTKLKSDPKYSAAIDEIEEEIGIDQLNIESFLTNIKTKRSVIGKGSLNGLNESEFDSLVDQTKKHIIEIVSVHRSMSIDNYEDMVHVDLARWIGRANRRYPVEIFTTNYDYLFEIALEQNSVPYFDGFSGSYNPFFCPELVENLSYAPQQTKLWKVHGSLGWATDERSGRVVRGFPEKDNLLIYPSMLKYVNSRKQPYTALMDRLSNFLKQADSVLFVCGYSFQDEHINERIMSALVTDTTSHVYALVYDKYWDEDGVRYWLTRDSDLAKLAKSNGKLSVFGCRNAIIGCQYGEWRTKQVLAEGEALYFTYTQQEPGGPDHVITEDDKQLTSGELTIVDFAKFVGLLKSMIVENKLLEKENAKHPN